MITKDYEKQQKTITGFDEQEELIKLFASTISSISEMSEGMLSLHLKQALNDVLEKRHTTFKKIKAYTIEEKKQFIHDLVIITIKRAKLVNAVEPILVKCEKAYESWKKIYRPEEV